MTPQELDAIKLLVETERRSLISGHDPHICVAALEAFDALLGEIERLRRLGLEATDIILSPRD